MGWDFVAFDLETTGVSKGTAICELAFVKYIGGVKSGSFSTLIKPEITATWQVNAISRNGITKKMVADSPSFRDSQQEVRNFIGSLPLVAHNASFDINRWTREGGFPLESFCSMAFVNSLIPETKSMSLEETCSSLGIKIETAHRAESDADACANLFLECLRKFPGETFESLETEFVLTKFKPTEVSRQMASEPKVSRALRKSEFAALSAVGQQLVNDQLRGKTVIFSDTKTFSTRQGQQVVALFGGISLDNVSKETDYLVIETQDRLVNEPTTKMRSALKLQAKGAKLEIITAGRFIEIASKAHSWEEILELI